MFFEFVQTVEVVVPSRDLYFSFIVGALFLLRTYVLKLS